MKSPEQKGPTERIDENKLEQLEREEYGKETIDLAPSEYEHGEIMVKFKQEATRHEITQLMEQYEATIQSSHAFNIKKLKIPTESSVSEVIELFEKNPLVEYAEPILYDIVLTFA